MQDSPGYNCDCGKTMEINSKTETENHDEEVRNQDRNEELCSQCGATLEWQLNLDGTTTLECPHC